MRFLLSAGFILFSVTMFAQFMHPFAEMNGDAIVYYMNDDNLVIPKELSWSRKRVATPTKRKGPYEVRDYDREVNVLLTTEMFEPDPISTLYHTDLLSSFANGDTNTFTEYEDGVANGKHVVYHDNGQLLESGRYVSWSKSSTWRRFYENGNPRDSGQYIRGYREGMWKMWYENGNLESTGHYVQGNRMGVWRSYHENGSLKSEVAFMSGSIEGEYVEFYDNDVIASKGNYLEGVRTGTWTGYYESGKERYSASFIDGDLDGPLRLLSEQGDTIVEGAMTVSGFNGFEQISAENDLLTCERMYVNGMIAKEVCTDQGGIKRHVAKNSGEILSYQCFDEQGVEIECQNKGTIRPSSNANIESQWSTAMQPHGEQLKGFRAVASFTVGVDGILSELEIVNGIIPEIDAVIERAMLGTVWNPGFYNGYPNAYHNHATFHFNEDGVSVHISEFYLSEEDIEANSLEKLVLDLTYSPPQFIGGEEALFGFIGSETNYPPYGRDAGAQGIVYVQFSVLPSGAISNIELLRTVNPALDYEAMRVVSKMPDWKNEDVALKDGMTYYKLPFRFTLK